jgi:hypothetical protein
LENVLEYFTEEEMEDIVRVAEENLFGGPGQTNVNHAKCSAGEDTKKRLYVRITEDNSKILAFCHHCNRRGMKRKSLLYRIPSENAVVAVWDDNKGLEVSNLQKMKWATALEAFLNAKPITKKLIADWAGLEFVFPLKFFGHQHGEGHWDELEKRDYYGMRLTPTAVIIPRYGSTGLLGLDQRDLAASSPSLLLPRKWKRTLALANDGEEVAGRLIVYNTNNSKTGCIVEDPISAMRLDLLGIAGIALTGSSLNTDDAFKLSLLYDRFVVWLDNDNDTVIKNATATAMRLGLYTSGKIGIVQGHNDPKKHTDEEIHTIIRGALS